MPLLDDPDQFTDSALDDGSTNVYINTTAQTIKLVPGVGGLVAADGALLKAVYSFIKEEWRNDPLTKNLAAFDFPFQPITDEFYELKDGWNWADAVTRQSIRRGGWLVRDTAGNVTEHWAAIAILSAQSDDQIYYELPDGTVADFNFPGNTAEAVQIISDPNGDGDYADGFDNSSNIVVRNRQQGQTYSSASSTQAGEASLLAPKLFSLGLPTGTDLNISTADVGIDANSDGTADVAPYTGMSITFFTTPQSRLIGAVNYDFGIIIDGNNGTREQIYEYVQWALRQTNDQDAGVGVLNGNVMPQLLEFVGSDLKTLNATNYQGGGTGVYIDNFSAVDTNNLFFQDNTGTEQKFPFVAAGTLQFNTNLVNDTDAVYRVYFSDGVDPGLEFGNSTAILVDNNAGTDLSGSVSGQASISFDFDYDGNTQGNRTAGTDANVTAIAIGLNTGQYVKTSATIGRNTGNIINFVSATERNYANPV